jgi:hypothetical protein
MDNLLILLIGLSAFVWLLVLAEFVAKKFGWDK